MIIIHFYVKKRKKENREAVQEEEREKKRGDIKGTFRVYTRQASNKVSPASIQRKKDIVHEWEIFQKKIFKKTLNSSKKRRRKHEGKRKNLSNVYETKKEALAKLAKNLNKYLKRRWFKNALISNS